jgi:hypothetical protein
LPIWQLLGGLALITLLAAAPAHAQISPGPLSRAHQSLNGPTNCTACHRLGSGQAKFKCVECHTEIASRLAVGKGLHASYHIPQGSSNECVRCHSEHNGEDFPIIKWDRNSFDHSQTGYALEGRHAGLACSRCHSSGHIEPSARALIKVKDLNKTFLGTGTACITCHQDQHNGRLGQKCEQCHNPNDWKSIKIGEFDHSKTRYPLTGLHANVTCQKCHTPGTDNKPRYLGLVFGKCSDCHSDPHRGSFAQTCQSCHNTGGWKRVSLNSVSEKFDHSKTKYPLIGKHAEVQCALCHAGGDFKKPLAFQKCMDCHKSDPHNGQFAKRADGGDCASCHGVEGFKPAKFGLAEHASTLYPLLGKHAEVKCDQCHVPRGKDTLFKIKFQHCTDCHSDQHGGQFAAAPYFNRCEQCHNVQGYRPSTFTLARHKQTRFILTGGHVATPCGDCHKQSMDFTPKPVAMYHWDTLSCTSCHNDPHNGQFRDRMLQVKAGKQAGCEACHTTNSWKELSGFDHSQTKFPLLGAHRATACIDCHKPPQMETRLMNADFRSAPTRCEQCHEDIHGRQFEKAGVTSCVDCHNSFKWKPSLFDHDTRTQFALRGVHRNVRCEGCHKSTKLMEGNAVLFYKPTPKDCAACHGADVVGKKQSL